MDNKCEVRYTPPDPEGGCMAQGTSGYHTAELTVVDGPHAGTYYGRGLTEDQAIEDAEKKANARLEYKGIPPFQRLRSIVETPRVKRNHSDLWDAIEAIYEAMRA